MEEPMQASQDFHAQRSHVGVADLGRNHHGKEAADEAFHTSFLHQWLFYIISSVAMALQNIRLKKMGRALVGNSLPSREDPSSPTNY